MPSTAPRYRVVTLADLPPVACPCGQARRAFAEDDSPVTFHLTEIAIDARLHYHKQLTEIYYILEAEEGAKLQLDDELIAVRTGMCILIPPGVRHRGVGRMKALIVAQPKFDPADEWFD